MRFVTSSRVVWVNMVRPSLLLGVLGVGGALVAGASFFFRKSKRAMVLFPAKITGFVPGVVSYR